MAKSLLTAILSAQSMVHHKLRAFGYCFLLLSLGFFGLLNNQLVLQAAAIPVPETYIEVQQPQVVPTFSVPTHVNIGTLIDQPITEHALVKEGDLLELESQHVVHFDQSALPGEAGNMILYGHNKQAILGKLKQVKVGEKISITDAEGKKFTYLITDVKTVETTETEWLQPTSDAVVTLYTCIGFLDRQRLVVRGSLVYATSSQE